MNSRKPSLRSPNPQIVIISFLLLGALSLPDIASAKPDKKGGSSHNGGKPDKSHSGRDSHSRNDSGNSHDRSHYQSRPRSSFSLNFGLGYAGRGYYYGPPGVPYYYERSDVRYYRTRELAPREYWGQQEGYRRMSLGASVQQALARRGYYRGGIDGEIGPYSRRSIARYQEDHGLRPTGLISSSLLRSLGLE